MIRLWLLLVGVATALALPTGALAHVTVAPSTVAPGVHTLTLTVPNEFQIPGGRSVINEVEVEAAAGLTIKKLEPRGKWTARVVGGSGVWRGGSIRFGGTESFVLRVDVPKRRDRLACVVATHFSFPPRREERFPIALRITGEKADGDTNGTIIVLVAIGAALALVAIAASLARWLRGPRAGTSRP